jgi:hypothetical protein
MDMDQERYWYRKCKTCNGLHKVGSWTTSSNGPSAPRTQPISYLLSPIGCPERPGEFESYSQDDYVVLTESEARGGVD